MMWGFFATVVAFWGVMFPFRYRMFKDAGHLKYLYIPIVIVGTILPCVPAFINLEYGYLFKTNRPLACEGANRDILLYCYLIPVSVLTGVSVSMIILVFWKLFKVGSYSQIGLGHNYACFLNCMHPFCVQQYALKKMRKTMCTPSTTTVERKVLIVLIYYVLLAISIFISFAVESNPTVFNTQIVIRLILCESLGIQPGLECNAERREVAVRILLVAVLDTMTYLLLFFLPVLFLLVVVNYTKLIATVKQLLHTPQKLRSTAGL